MKKSILTLLLLLVISPKIYCQTECIGFEWAKSFIGSSLGRSIAVDAVGNSYVTGGFSGTANFGSMNLISSGADDIFVAKIDASGNYLWVIQAGGSDNDKGKLISLDVAGNIYIIGDFQGTASFGNTNLTSSGSNDFFVAKIDANGNYLWAKQPGGSYPSSIAVDATGNSYIIGDFEGTASFGSTNLTSSGSFDIFIAKLDVNGNYSWAKKAGGLNQDFGESIAVDAIGNSYITGSFQGTSSFGGTNITSSGSSDIFVVKIDANGSYIWAKKAGGFTSDNAKSIAVDVSGNSYITGYFGGSTSSATASFGSTILTSFGYKEIFVAKLDVNGNYLWAKKAGGAGHDLSYSIAIDDLGNTYITGTFTESASFGSTNLITSVFNNFFVAKTISTSISLSLTVNNNSITCGNNTQLNALLDNPTTGVNYSWLPAIGLNNPNISNPLGSPNSTTTYTVTATNLDGCTVSDEVMITVNPFTLNLTTSSNTIACGNSTQLNSVLSEPISGVSYSWSPTTGLSNPTIANPIANPINNTNYSLTAIKDNCIASSQISVTVVPFTVTASSVEDTMICGNPTHLNSILSEPINGVNYFWSPTTGLSSSNISNPIASPTVTTDYYLTAVKGGCNATSLVTIVVNPYSFDLEALSIYCGDSTQLNPILNPSFTGSVNYLWSPSTGLSSNIIASPIASPAISTNYNVTGTLSNGCLVTNDAYINVSDFNIYAPSKVIVCGTSTQLNADVFDPPAGVTYIWSPNINLSDVNTSSPTANPITTTTYTVTTSAPNGCSTSSEVMVMVNPYTITANDMTATCGNPTIINATVNEPVTGVYYSWSPTLNLTNSNSSSPTANLSSNKTYTVTATTSSGCTASDQVTVTVNPYVVNATTTSTSVSCGTSTQLNANVTPSVSSVNYLWTPSAGVFNPNSANAEVTPNSTTTYSVTASTSNGCSATNQVTITVTSPNFSVDALASGSPVECGGTIYLNAQLSTSVSGASYSWSPATGLSDPNIASPSASPRSNTTYTVTVTKPGGCIVADVVNVIVQNNNPQPLSISGGNGIACENGTNIYISGNGNYNNYQWSNGQTTSSITVNEAGTYTATGNVLNGNYTGCLAIGSITLAPLATINAPNGATLCNGSVVLEATGSTLSGAGFFWNNGQTTQSITVTQAGNYSCNVVQGNCSYTANIVVSPDGGSFTPTAFTSNVQANNVVSFSYTDPNINTATWDFGDGNTSTVASPTHIYASAGQYNVCLTATNFCDVLGSVCQNVTVSTVAGIEEKSSSSFSLFPNPATSSITLQFENQINSEFVTVYSISGQKVLHEKIASENAMEVKVNVSTLQSGIYYVEIGNSRKKFVVE